MTKHYSTLNGIKRAATKLKRISGLTHSAALEQVARDAGFADYHAAAAAHSVRQAASCHAITISEFWSDRPRGERGNESRAFSFDQPLEALVRPHHLTGYLSGVRLQGGAIVGYGDSDSLERARAEICRVARTLQFMSATGLKPSRAARCFPKGSWDNRPPGTDHDHGWYDPKTRSYVLTEEPYPGRFDYFAAERAAWADKHGWRSVRSRWASVYGHGTELHLTAKARGGVDVEALAKRLGAQPAPFDEDFWPNSSSRNGNGGGRPAALLRSRTSVKASDSTSEPVEMIEMSPALSALLKHQRDLDIAEAGSQAPEASVEHRGVLIESRWSMAHELDTMRRMIDAMPEGVSLKLDTIWCDSKACAFYTVEVTSGRWIEGIEHPIREALLDVTDGFNGLIVQGDGREIWFDPEWPGNDFDHTAEL